MMRYLLDTNIISDLVANPDGRAAQAMAAVADSALFTSIIVVMELQFGVAKRRSQRLKR